MRLSVEKGCFAYKKDRPILRNVDFEAQSGELIAVLGPNGSGKTTLLRCLTGYLRWNSGRSLLDGEDTRAIPAKRFWQKVAYVPQARGAASSLTVEEMILLGRTGRVGVFSAPGSADLQLIRDLAERLGIAGLLRNSCSRISGGELQMVLIARALAAEPQLIILDEPESNLDFKNQLIVLDSLSALTRQGMCCIFNTHYPTHALSRAGRSLLLNKGGDYIFGETRNVLTEENIRRAFGVHSLIGELSENGQSYPAILPLSVIQEKNGS